MFPLEKMHVKLKQLLSPTIRYSTFNRRNVSDISTKVIPQEASKIKEAVKKMTIILKRRNEGSVFFDYTKHPDCRDDFSFLFMKFSAPTPLTRTALSTRKWLENRKLYATKKLQVFDIEDLKIKGHELTAAHFILSMGGMVKFKDQSEWTVVFENNCNVPEKFDPNYVIEAIDASFTDICYEGFDHLNDLKEVKWLNLKECPLVDDWCVDKIPAEFPVLEHLDLSYCKQVTEKGLEGLYKIPSLKKLIVTNYNKTAAFELTCLMLEDCNPNLTCEILEPKTVKTK